MSYQPRAKAARKEWFPKEGPFIILWDIPPGKPSLLKPDLKKCPTVKVMKDSVLKLKIRMSKSEQEWWEAMIKEEEKKVKLWDSLSKEDYQQAGETFDLLEFRYPEPVEPAAHSEEDLEYREQDEKLLHLIEKKENHRPVSFCLSVCEDLCTMRYVCP